MQILIHGDHVKIRKREERREIARENREEREREKGRGKENHKMKNLLKILNGHPSFADFLDKASHYLVCYEPT